MSALRDEVYSTRLSGGEEVLLVVRFHCRVHSAVSRAAPARAASLASLLQALQHLVEAKATDLLALRVVLERGEELPDVLLRGHQQEHVL